MASEGKGSDGSGKAKITVAPTSNPRQGSISYLDGEVDQCILDILSWLYAKAPSLDLKSTKGADSATLQALEKRFDPMPAGVADILKLHDGGALLNTFTMLSSAGIVSAAEDMARQHGGTWKETFVPVGRDLDDDLLVADAASHRVFTFSGADGEIMDTQDITFGTYLETFRNKLLSNKFEHLEDCGLVERVGDSSPKGKKRPEHARAEPEPEQRFSGK